MSNPLVVNVPLAPAQPAHAASLLKFVQLRCQAEALLREASRLPNLPAHYDKQAEAAANLAGVTLHRVRGAPRSDDAKHLATDLLFLARRVVDPLIAAIGDHAVDALALPAAAAKQHFTDQLLCAVEGNATQVLEERGAQIDDSLADFYRARAGFSS
jgi:hypothetical protein